MEASQFLQALQALEAKGDQQAATLQTAMSALQQQNQLMAQQLKAQQEASAKQAADMTAALTAMSNFAAQQQQQTASLQAGQRAAEQATEAAKAAAASAQAERKRAEPTSQAMRSIIDVKSVGKPTTFKGEEAKYPNWRNKTAFYLNGLFPGAFSILAWIELVDGPIRLDDIADRFPAAAEYIEELQQCLYTLLGCITEDDPLTTVLNVEFEDGFEAWRKISRRYDLRTTARTRTMLLDIMKVGEAKMSNLLAELEVLERKMTLYEQRKKVKMDDELKTASLLSLCPKAIRNHVDLNADAYGDYATVRKLVVSYTENQISGSSAMDVSAINPKDGSCRLCGSLDHWSKECPKAKEGKGKDGGGKGKGKGQGKGKEGKGKGQGKDGGKGQGKGKGKGKGKGEQKKCWYCHGTTREFSHWTSECRGPGGGKGGKAINAVNDAAETASSSSADNSAVVTLMKSLQEIVNRHNGQKALTIDSIVGLGSLGIVPDSINAVNAMNPVTTGVKSQIMRTDGYDTTRVRAGLDSGAAESVCPKDFAVDYPTRPTKESESGRKFRVANGNTIDDEGQVRPVVYTDKGVIRELALTKCDVHKVLLSAGKIVRKGDIVHLELNNSYILSPSTGEKIDVQLDDDNTFSVEFQMVPADDINALVQKQKPGKTPENQPRHGQFPGGRGHGSRQ